MQEAAYASNLEPVPLEEMWASLLVLAVLVLEAVCALPLVALLAACRYAVVLATLAVAVWLWALPMRLLEVVVMLP